MSRIRGIAIATTLLATIASTLRVYPHQLAYFNELAGGPENGHRHLLCSNLDWRQDLLLIDEWADRRGVQAEAITVCSYGMAPWQELFGFSSEDTDLPGWRIISANRLFNCDGNAEWDSQMVPEKAHRLGYTLWVFPTELSARDR